MASRPRVFLDIDVDQQPAGRLILELFASQHEAPKTCENFRQLCIGEHKGLTYANVPFHRVIDNFMCQGGDIAKGDGTGVTSIYDGQEFEDENLRDIDSAGLLCSANRGPDTNGSQFFITLEPCDHLTGRHTVFGRLVSGQDVLDKIAKVPVDSEDRPRHPVLISRCGELERKRQQQIPADESAVSSSSGDRGRRRRSGSDVDMSASPPPRVSQRSRRQSDNVIDEGLRGRPRQRSASHSPSQAIQESEESDEVSPTEKHKRKRSPSPSRHTAAPPPRNDETSYGQRRRRSLPNQYAQDKNRRYRDDEDRYRPSPRRDNQYTGHRGQRQTDRYRPRDRFNDEGRLGSNDRLEDEGTGEKVTYKGRGSMKFREPGRL
ncbi:hypothetical protein Q7P37_009365 [Cladosporium fusiforme]